MLVQKTPEEQENKEKKKKERKRKRASSQDVPNPIPESPKGLDAFLEEGKGSDSYMEQAYSDAFPLQNRKDKNRRVNKAIDAIYCSKDEEFFGQKTPVENVDELHDAWLDVSRFAFPFLFSFSFFYIYNNFLITAIAEDARCIEVLASKGTRLEGSQEN